MSASTASGRYADYLTVFCLSVWWHLLRCVEWKFWFTQVQLFEVRITKYNEAHNSRMNGLLTVKRLILRSEQNDNRNFISKRPEPEIWRSDIVLINNRFYRARLIPQHSASAASRVRRSTNASIMNQRLNCEGEMRGLTRRSRRRWTVWTLEVARFTVERVRNAGPRSNPSPFHAA